MTTDQVSELRKIVEAPDTGLMYAESLRDAIDEIDGKPSHKGFLKLCELATLAYSQGGSSAQAIQENKATPLLVNYLLDAFRHYQDQDSQQPKASTPKRREFMYLSFSAGGGARGGNTRAPVWDTPKEMEIYAIFSKAFHHAHEARVPTETAWQMGYDAAYAHAFKADALNGRDPKSKRAKTYHALLEALLNQHQPRSTILKFT